MSIKSRVTKSNKNAKIVALALVMAVVAGGLAFATTHNGKQTTKNSTAEKTSSGVRTVTTKDGKKVMVPNTTSTRTPEEKNKANELRLQKRIDSAVKQKRITDAQAKLIKAKVAELAKADYSKQDTKARAEAQKKLHAWAKDNNIPMSFVFEMSRPRA